MGRDGIGCAFDAFKCERDAYALSLSRYTRIQLAGSLHGAELSRAVLGARHAFARHLRIELERKPADFGAHFAGECRERFAETAFADVTPRADHVGNNFDGQRSAHRPESSEKPAAAPPQYRARDRRRHGNGAPATQ